MAGTRRKKSGRRAGREAPGRSPLAAQLERAQSDCVELIEANRRLRESSRRRDDLLALSAYELRTKVEQFLTVARRALGEAGGEQTPQERRALEAVEQQARRVGEVAEELVGFRSVDAPRLESGPEPSGEAPPYSQLPGTAGPSRILVVDDDADARESLAQMLEPAYQVATARDGSEALRVTRAEPPDLVLMDLVMPHMDGFAVLESMRAEASTADIPVIILSARGDDDVRARALDMGAVDFLGKPCSRRELLARIERTLRLTRRQLQFRQMAQTDTLTGLANLRAFRARLEEEVKRARRYHNRLTCVMTDMDFLKGLNDELGHAAGDRAIAAVADVIRLELRETDFAARYGGDEFVMLLPQASAEDGRVLAQRVCDHLKESALAVAGRRVPLSASFGVAEMMEGDEAGESMVWRADEALYQVKRAGRGAVAVWSGEAQQRPARA